jgi:hypothetical protein
VVHVIYDFSGYFSPIGAVPSFNLATAGRPLTLGFSLAGPQGLAIFAAGFPVSTPIACGSSALLDSGTATATIAPGLSYGGGRYSYFWKTDKAWAGTCRQFIALLTDGTYHRANFRFK